MRRATHISRWNDGRTLRTGYATSAVDDVLAWPDLHLHSGRNTEHGAVA